ncbi:MAG: histidine phosphatase family protein [Myxococcales bacterium]|nr:histidine phosphatase family protein [Myxococcales bacterium]
MRIFLVRHGDAVPEEDAGSDRDRWLSPKGREHARILGRLLREQGITPEAILCSPLPRAVQTAELLAHALDFFGVITSLRCLEPSSQPRVAANEIRAVASPVIVVSHEPAISNLGAFLLGLPAFPQFRTAQCCGLEEGKPTFSARPDLGLVQPLFVD